MSYGSVYDDGFLESGEEILNYNPMHIGQAHFAAGVRLAAAAGEISTCSNAYLRSPRLP